MTVFHLLPLPFGPCTFFRLCSPCPLGLDTSPSGKSFHYYCLAVTPSIHPSIEPYGIEVESKEWNQTNQSINQSINQTNQTNHTNQSINLNLFHHLSIEPLSQLTKNKPPLCFFQDLLEYQGTQLLCDSIHFPSTSWIAPSNDLKVEGTRIFHGISKGFSSHRAATTFGILWSFTMFSCQVMVVKPCPPWNIVKPTESCFPLVQLLGLQTEPSALIAAKAPAVCETLRDQRLATCNLHSSFHPLST